MTSEGEGALGKWEDGRRLADDGDGVGGDGGAAVQRRRWLVNGGVTVTTVKYPCPGQVMAAVVAAASEAAMTVGLLPQPSLSSHLRGRALFSFFQMTARVCEGSLPLL